MCINDYCPYEGFLAKYENIGCENCWFWEDDKNDQKKVDTAYAYSNSDFDFNS